MCRNVLYEILKVQAAKPMLIGCSLDDCGMLQQYIYCILNYVHMASVDLRRYECVGVLKEQTHELSHDKYIPTYCLRYNTPA